MSADILDVVKCSKSEDEHIIENANELPCGHLACKKCTTASISSHTKCLKCKSNSIDDPNFSDHGSIHSLIEANLNTLFKVINSKIEEENVKYKGERICHI
jgi:uncharacterized OB-fold protein